VIDLTARRNANVELQGSDEAPDRGQDVVMRQDLRFPASESAGEVSAILDRPEDARCVYVFAHGAGAGMRHPFMERMSKRLAERGIATYRYNFVYMEAKKGRPDARPLLLETVRSAVRAAHAAAPGLPVFAGGKSMGGRMTSGAAAEGGLDELRGIVFFGFPLYSPGKPSTERADHLDDVRAPLLFLEGTRDAFADLDVLRPVCERLGDRATLHIEDHADHSFHVPKRSGRTDDDVMDSLADVTRDWMLARI
jgi:predicted alpha/beta-hydrolase family hydrolase